MPTRRYHLEFDDVLRSKRIIFEKTDGNSVHARMDKNSKKYGEAHRKLDDFHSPEGIRDFVDQIVNSLGTIHQETATDYVRIAYGHMCLDYMASKLTKQYRCTYDELDWNYVYKRTLRYYRDYGYDRTYYRFRY